MKYFIAVKGIIVKDHQILIVKRSDADDHRPGVWETVGGHMDREASPEKELQREVAEETGLSVTVREPFHTFSFVKDTGEFVIGITYICDYMSGNVVLSDEHADYQWINPKHFGNFASTQSLHAEIAQYAKKKND